MLNKTSKLVVIAIFAIGLAGCANSDFSHEYLMSGQVVSTDSGVTVCVGEANGAEVGQILTAYRVIDSGNIAEGDSAFSKVDIGKVKISELVDDHFAKVTVLSGDIKKHDMVQLNN